MPALIDRAIAHLGLANHGLVQLGRSGQAFESASTRARAWALHHMIEDLRVHASPRSLARIEGAIQTLKTPA